MAPNESRRRNSERGTFPFLAVQCEEKSVPRGGSTENKYLSDRTERGTGRVRVVPGRGCRRDSTLKVTRGLN